MQNRLIRYDAKHRTAKAKGETTEGLTTLTAAELTAQLVAAGYVEARITYNGDGGKWLLATISTDEHRHTTQHILPTPERIR